MGRGRGRGWVPESCMPYLLGFPLWKATLVQVTDHMGVCLNCFFFQVAHKGMAQLGGQHIRHKVCVEEDTLQLAGVPGLELPLLKERGKLGLICKAGG